MLTDTQKSAIRLYLGYPDNFRQQDVRLESIMNNLSPEAEDQVASVLANLATIESAVLDNAVIGAGVKRMDEIWFENGGSVMRELRKLGRFYTTRLSIVCGVPTYSDYWSGNGYKGDNFTPGGGGANGTGHFPLG